MLSKKMNDMLNDQVNKEMFSSYLYLSMSAWLAQNGLPGFAVWMRSQADEEYEHCMKFFDYIHERGGIVELGAVDAPRNKWNDVEEVAKEIFDHEKMVTGLINNLMDVALAEKDHATTIFLHWFVAEQVEEEASVGEILDRVKMIGKDSGALYHLDMELAKRGAVSQEENQTS